MTGARLNRETLLRLYRDMLRIRTIEEAIAELYSEQEMRCPVHLCTGQEAVAVGVCAQLEPEDYVLSGHRSHGHYLAKGGNLKAMMAELYGKATGCARGKGGSMHLVDLEAGFLGAAPIVGSTIAIAVGAAFGSVMKGERRVTVIFFGEGAVEAGVFHESINFAALKKLPVVFVCENNLYSVYSPLSVRQAGGREVFELARGHGVESHHADGNDVVAVYALAESAVAKARKDEGPVFLEFATYRWREHCGPNYDNDLGYRSEAEFALWRERCPVERLKAHLLDQGVASEETLAATAREVRDEIDEATAFAKESPFPTAETALEGIFASPPAHRRAAGA